MTENLSSPKKTTDTPSVSQQPLLRNQLLGLGSFLFFVALVAILYLQNKWQWENQFESQQVQLDSLEALSKDLAFQLEFLEEEEQIRIAKLRANEFDSFDEDFYRIYGLYRDRNKVLTRDVVSRKFNVFNASTIKQTDVLGERWFIVPVMGQHFMRKGETLAEITKLYYKNPADSSLILQFNPIIKASRNLFIPFSD